jgi:hypothetical protein
MRGVTVGLYKLNSLDPWFERAWFQPLNLSSDFWFFKFSFSQIQLVPLLDGSARRLARKDRKQDPMLVKLRFRRYADHVISTTG